MTEHFCVLCTDCGKIMTQCRCPIENKHIEYDTCTACKLIHERPMTTEEADIAKGLDEHFAKLDTLENEMPMGVSEWERHGKRFGYWEFFKNKK